jgi:hypothetical protein
MSTLRSLSSPYRLKPAAYLYRTTNILHTTSPSIRAFSLTSIRLLKEDAERSPEHIEGKKQEQIDKQKKGKGEWHESLASSGESNIKADREQVHDHDEHMEKLQKETAQKSQDR